MADEIKTTAAEASESRNFIHTFIEEDIAQGGQFEGMTVHTRFPPEPNGYPTTMKQKQGASTRTHPAKSHRR